MKRISLALVALACVTLAAPALAWRRPTARQKQAIVRVAKRAPHAGTGAVRVSNIRISTVGPWASVTLSLPTSTGPDIAGAVLHRVRGRWRLTRNSPGTDGIQCGIGMPVVDQRNLGFGRCP
jgi:hypothetical protein